MRALTLLVPLSLLGCMSQEAETTLSDQVDHAQADAQPGTRLVISHLELPLAPEQYDALGFDLDGDNRQGIDNKLAAILQLAIADVDKSWDMQGTVNAQVASGQSPLLGELRAGGDGSAGVMRLMFGRDVDADPSNNFTNGVFALDLGRPADSVLYGTVMNQTFTSAEPGAVLLDLALTEDGTPIRFHLLGAHVQIAPDARQPRLFHGKLGGGILRADIDTQIGPVIAKRVHDYALVNPGTPATARLLDLFDLDHDGDITVAEFLRSNTTQLLASPDVDLFKNPTTLAPGKDGRNDCISAGIGFDAVPATF